MTVLDIQKRLTKAFIDTAPVSLTLTPRNLVSDGEGGKRQVPGTPRTAQTFMLSEPSDSGARLPVATSDGEQLTIDFMLLGEFDAVIAEGDVFVYNGYEYKIETIMPFNGYERRALVIRHGW